ncbi:aminoglycoside phosphotransferase family protein [Plectonema cf. radiosum LEGE 06105]|uniref:Aminoglycoside phosphotransferase family protein n=1 Tax=Plectonema cf. radiosum LEGE 06105 TaxID=945769 RepID=A0A8J7F222_9CYAN|nr:aminoglycoside phosphotransferase family protein [Plectonema radiosum]MBE9211520.1 aminoglycoside phosphotransferase family protein [Plectonema cf. radiosum LEGE 06105]
MFASFDRKALTNRAVAASVAVAAKHDITVDEPKILADAYSVRVHLQPAPIVVRVSTLTPILRYPIASWLLREIAVAEFLAAKDTPVVPPSDLLPSGVHSHDGLFMTFWQYVPRVSDIIPDSGTVGKMLAELHAVLKDYPGELPLLAPPFNDIPRGIERLQQVGNILSAEDLQLLRETYDTSIGKFNNSRVPLQPLHGDAHAYNLIPTAKGLVWNDFEDTCMGSVSWDLINLDDAGRKAYSDIPDLEMLEIYQTLRKIHGIVWVFSLSPEFPDWVEYAQTMLNELRGDR